MRLREYESESVRSDIQIREAFPRVSRACLRYCAPGRRATKTRRDCPQSHRSVQSSRSYAAFPPRRAQARITYLFGEATEGKDGCEVLAFD